jgi:hypothetical protein
MEKSKSQNRIALPASGCKLEAKPMILRAADCENGLAVKPTDLFYRNHDHLLSN